MTLFKQVALAVSTIIIIMLAAVMYINYEAAKKDMIESLYQTTVNNISTLTSKLAEAGDEPAMIETTIDSEFDSGYYKLIEYKSKDGEFSYKQADKDPIENVPQWFVDYTTIDLKPVTADVSSGWSVTAEVKVAGDTAIIYTALYQMFIKLLYLFGVFVTIALIVLSVLLHFVLKPLKEIQHQAEAIIKNEFVIQEKVPYTTEFKEVVKGMNTMVKKVQDIFEKGNEAAKRNRELLYNDPVTKLFNRRYLMLKLPDLIKLENKTNGGTIMFVALNGAEIINQKLGRRDADELFLKFASLLKECSNSFEETLIARVNGTEFTLVIPDSEIRDTLDISKEISISFNDLLSKNNIDFHDVYINMGIYKYNPNISIAELLTRADNALSNAKADTKNDTYVYEEKDEDHAMGKEQWRNIIEDSIKNNYFSLRFWSTMDTQTKKIKHKVMTFTIDAGEDKRYFYGDFIAPAINLGLVSQIYIVALKDLITSKHSEIAETICSVRLSNEFIKDSKSFTLLSELLEEYSKNLDFKLYFEVSDSFASNNIALMKSFTELFKKHHFGFGINSFTGESSDFAYLKELSPSFIKADISFLLDQSQDSMSAIQVVTDSLGIDIIATFVKTQDELKELKQKHITIVQGPITDNLLKSS